MYPTSKEFLAPQADFSSRRLLVRDPGADRRPRGSLREAIHRAITVRHMSPRTEKAYVGWIRRFLAFHGGSHPLELRKADIEAFAGRRPRDSRFRHAWGATALTFTRSAPSLSGAAEAIKSRKENVL